MSFFASLDWPSPRVVSSGLFAKLIRLLKQCRRFPPPIEGRFLEITDGYEFEPHGIASETFEEVFYLTLPHIPHHWKGPLSGWQKSTGTGSIHFQGKTLSEVVEKAIAFLEDMEEPK